MIIRKVPIKPDTEIAVTMNSVSSLSRQDSLTTALIWQKKCLIRLGLQKEPLNIIPVSHRDKEASSPSRDHKFPTHHIGHKQRISERVADGQEVIIPHQSENETVSATKSQEGTHLQATTYDWNASILDEEICQHLGDDSQYVAGLRERECTKEEVHGCVEMTVHPSKTHDGQVTCEGEKVKAKEYHKEDCLCMWVNRKAKKNELFQDCLVDLHCLDIWNLKETTNKCYIFHY